MGISPSVISGERYADSYKAGYQFLTGTFVWKGLPGPEGSGFPGVSVPEGEALGKKAKLISGGEGPFIIPEAFATSLSKYKNAPEGCQGPRAKRV
jgi:hypothetical protein